MRRPPRSPLFPSRTLSRPPREKADPPAPPPVALERLPVALAHQALDLLGARLAQQQPQPLTEIVGSQRPLDALHEQQDRKSTRLNSSHANISYAVFCLKKK